MKRKYKLSISIASLIIVGGLTASSVYLLTKPKNNPITKKENLGNKKEYSIDIIPSLNIYQYPAYIDQDKKPVYFFNEYEINKIIERFSKEINFGPEVFGLKSIIINDLNLTSPLGEEGVFVPATGELGVSTQAIIEDLTSDQKIERFFEVLYHEYGHYLFYKYVSSPFPNDLIENNIKTYRIDHNGKRDDNHFNKKFISWFKKDFRYNDTSIDNTIIKPNNKSWPEAISSKFSLKDLYDDANVNPNLNFTKNYGLYSYDKSNNFLDENDIFGINTLNSNESKYYYSLEELLTRKYQLSSMRFGEPTKEIIYPFSGEFNLMSNIMLYDILNYQTVYYSNYQSGKPIPTLQEWVRDFGKTSFFTEVKFYNDDPFSRSIENPNELVGKVFLDKMMTMMGQKNGYDITWIQPKNSHEIYSNGIAVKGSNWTSDEGNYIKLGGYIKNIDIINSKNISLVYKGNGKYNKIDDITKVEKQIFYKNNLYDSQLTSKINGARYIWSTNSYLDAKDFEDKELYFSYKDAQNITQYQKLTSFRGRINTNEEGLSSSWEEEYITSDSSSNIWKAESNNNGGVIIKSSEKYESAKYN